MYQVLILNDSCNLKWYSIQYRSTEIRVNTLTGILLAKIIIHELYTLIELKADRRMRLYKVSRVNFMFFAIPSHFKKRAPFCSNLRITNFQYIKFSIVCSLRILIIVISKKNFIFKDYNFYLWLHSLEYSVFLTLKIMNIPLFYLYRGDIP